MLFAVHGVHPGIFLRVVNEGGQAWKTTIRLCQDVPAFEQIALAALRDPMSQKRIVVMDVIGKMELASPRFCDLVRELPARAWPEYRFLTSPRLW